MANRPPAKRARPAGPPAPWPERPVFDLWRIPGRKCLALDAAGLILLAAMPALRLQALLPKSLAHGAPYACCVPLEARLRERLEDFLRQAEALHSRLDGPPWPPPRQHPPARAPSRSALLHLRALQALDGAQAGASQREIAQALFGDAAVALRWSADGELRAQVRHLLWRAQGFMRGGYLALAGLDSGAPSAPGGRPGDGSPA